MEIEVVYWNLREIHHVSSTDIKKIKVESKDISENYKQLLSYINDYSKKNGFTVFTVDDNKFYLKKV